MADQTIEKPWYMATVQQTAAEFDVSITKGLTDEQVLARKKLMKRKQHAKKLKTPRLPLVFWCLQLVIFCLAVAIYLLSESKWALLFALGATAFWMFGLAQQNYVRHILATLVKPASPKVSLVRAGKKCEYTQNDIVLGDIVVLQTGDFIPADLRLIEVSGLTIDEHTLFGNAAPVKKVTHALHGKTKPANQTNIAFGGSLVHAGSAKGIVVAPLVPVSADTAIPKERLTKAQKKRRTIVCFAAFFVGLCTFVSGIPLLWATILGLLLSTSSFYYADYWLRYTAWVSLYERLHQAGLHLQSITALQQFAKTDTIFLQTNEAVHDTASFIHALQAELRIEVRALVPQTQVKKLERELNIEQSALSQSEFLNARRNGKLSDLNEYQLMTSFDEIGIGEAISLREQAGHTVLWVHADTLPDASARVASNYITLSDKATDSAETLASGRLKPPTLKKLAQVFHEVDGFKKITAY